MKLLNRSVGYVFLGLCVFVAFSCIGYIVIFVRKLESSPATQLEITHFTLVTTFLTLFASIGITHFVSKTVAAKDIKLLGQSAIRHIRQIILSTKILSKTIERKTRGLNAIKQRNEQVDVDLILEYFDNLSNQISSLSIGINTARNDWANILTEEIQESIESDEEIWGYLKKIELLREEIEKKEEGMREEEEQRNRESVELEKLIEEKEEKIELLKQEEEKLIHKRMEIENKPSSWPTYLSTSVVGPSGTSSPLDMSGLGLGYTGTCDICRLNPASQACSKCGKLTCPSCTATGATTTLTEPVCRECSEA